MALPKHTHQFLVGDKKVYQRSDLFGRKYGQSIVVTIVALQGWSEEGTPKYLTRNEFGQTGVAFEFNLREV